MGSGEDVNQTEMLQRVFLEPLVLYLISNPSLEGFTPSQGTWVDLLHPEIPWQGDAYLSPLRDKPCPVSSQLLLSPKADVWTKRLSHTLGPSSPSIPLMGCSPPGWLLSLQKTVSSKVGGNSSPTQDETTRAPCCYDRGQTPVCGFAVPCSLSSHKHVKQQLSVIRAGEKDPHSPCPALA